MDTIQDAQQVLRDAETALRRLLEQSLKQNRYAEVARIAPLADGVSRLLHRDGAMGTLRTSRLPVSNGVPAPRKPARAQPPARTGPKGAYPRFERDGDRLVKIGWSKKKRSEYEHRAPREAVDAFVRHLAAHVTPGKVFTMEQLMPVPNPSTGDDLPAYQVYLTLAWLRHIGAVEKKGKDGYVLRNGSLDNGSFDASWPALASRVSGARE